MADGVFSWRFNYYRVALLAAASAEENPLHGNARWANSREIREAGLFSDDGIIVGVKKALWAFSCSTLYFPVLNTF